MEMEFARGYSNTNKISDRLLYVNNCGFYKNAECDMRVIRPKGRSDYQVIYISKGSMIFEFFKKDVIVQDGNIVIFRPGEPQLYRIAEPGSSFYWIHFSGTEAERIMSGLELNKNIYHTGEFTDFKGICKKIIKECRFCSQPNEYLVSSLAATALSLIPGRLPSVHHQRFRLVTDIMSSNPGKYTTDDYAKMCGLSTYHFIRAFKQDYKITPHAYEQTLAIDKSKRLLMESTMKISDIARMAGFDDALYFSRVFKRITGTSPREYRNNSNAF